jgi:hypothetical protein
MRTHESAVFICDEVFELRDILLCVDLVQKYMWLRTLSKGKHSF